MGVYLSTPFGSRDLDVPLGPFATFFLCVFLLLMAWGVGFGLPLWLPFLALSMSLLPLLAPNAKIKEPWMRVKIFLWMLSVFPCLAAGLCAPFRALFLWTIPFPIPWSSAIKDSAHMPALDVFVGTCGVLFAAVGGTWSVLTLWRQYRQVGNLPTSTARAAAVGLAEFKGVARPADPPGKRDVKQSGIADWKEAHDPDVLLYQGWDNTGPDTATCEMRSSFCVEDATGRILVDPGDAKFWTGHGAFFFEPVRKIFIEKRLRKSPLRGTRSLRAGDPVYLVGSVEVNPQAPLDAADSARLVVRPSSEVVRTGFLRRFILAEDLTSIGRQSRHVFFLSDNEEKSAEDMLLWSLHQAWLITAVWLAISLWLVLANYTKVDWPPANRPKVEEPPLVTWKIPFLMKDLDDHDPRVRAAAAQGLGEIGRDAYEALPKLRQRRADKDETPEVRTAADQAILKIQPPSSDAIPEP